MILAPSHHSLHVTDIFQISTLIEAIQLILNVISHLFGEDDANVATKATEGFLRDMMQLDHLFDIPSFLAKFIKF